MVTNSYEIIQLQDSNVKFLNVLYHNVYNKSCYDNYFKLKHNTSYLGLQHIGYFAILNGAPVAFCGVVPVRMSVGNKPIMAAQSCDIMVHPEHRKKGLFAVLSERIFALAKEKGIHFIFGFPNNNSYEGFVNRLGFTHLETMHRYTFSFNDSLFKKLSRKLLGFSMENNNQIIQNEFLNQGFDGVIYDKGYNSYKKYNKNKIIEHNGNYYWISRAGDLFVGAIQLKNPDQLTESLQFIEKTEKAVSATFMLSPGTQLGDALSKFYKAEEGFPIIVKNISGKYSLDNLKFQFSDIDIF